MIIRPANTGDLDSLKVIYNKIVDNLLENNIRIWDYVYPCEVFPEDIKRDSLFILEENGVICAAFALVDSVTGDEHIGWEDPDAPALFIYRLGVNVDYRGRGYAEAALKAATKIARERGAKYLRLFVGNNNPPAIELYRKCGFTLASGIYEQLLAGGDILHEYSFEISTDKV